MASVFVSQIVLYLRIRLNGSNETSWCNNAWLVGETTQGPAFQPIFISNYGEFQSFFGGLNATKIKDTGAPQYELAYIAKSYLSKSNQLFVTRVLGFSGYDAGLSWGIALDAALDPTTLVTTNSGTTYTGGSAATSVISYSATSAGTITTLVSANAMVSALINNGSLTSSLAFLGQAVTGTTASIPATYIKTGNSFSGVSFTLYVTHTNAGSNGSGIITGFNFRYYDSVFWNFLC